MTAVVDTLATICRVSSVISIICTLFIFTTFAAFPYFRKPINRLIVYASIGNFIANIATTISIIGLPQYGGSLALCRWQAFIGQMFVPADALWVLAMALNVHLTIFRHYTPQRLRKLEPWYFGIIYLISSTPAIVYLILDMPPFNKGTIGPAGLWCWVSTKYEWARFAFLYIPLWVIAFAAMAIYGRVGVLVLKNSRALRSFSISTFSLKTFLQQHQISHSSTHNEEPINLQPRIIPKSTTTAQVAEIHVPQEGRSERAEPPDLTELRLDSETELRPVQYHQSVALAQVDTIHSTSQATADATSSNGEENPAPGTNRVSTLAAFESGEPGYTGPTSSQRSENKAAWSYTKVAFLMYTALLIVWVPPTANRIYDYFNGEASFALEAIVAAAVPLQGFWNFTVYVATSAMQCRRAWNETRGKFLSLKSRIPCWNR